MKGESPGCEESSKENKEQKQVESSDSSAPAAAAAAAPASGGAAGGANPNARARQPFTQLSQLESDMAIARALQEQERAYMLLRNGSSLYNDGYDDEAEDDGNENDQVEGTTIDGSQFENDEAFARALQEADEREHTARMMALTGIHDLEEDEDEDEEDDGEEGDEDEEGDAEFDDEDEEEDEEEDGSDESQEWQDVDPDNMSYEELIALAEVVGTESKGLSADAIAELPVVPYKRGHTGGSTSSDSEQCVICRHDYEDDDLLLALPCKHKYHSDCIREWLRINKACPLCSAGVNDS